MEKKSIKSIIVAIDLSRYSRVVLKEAQVLASELRLPIKYVYVFDYFQTIGDTLQEFQANIRKKILKSYKLPDDVDLVLRLGNPVQEIIEVARKMPQLPLIVVGYKGYSRINHFFLGSTAEKVAMLSPFPVWIHRGQRAVLPKKVLIPSDFSDRINTIRSHLEVFEQRFKSDIELFHVIPQPIPILDYPAYSAVDRRLHEEDDKRFEAFQAKHPDIKTVRRQGNVIEKIENESKKFNLIAISPRDKSNKAPLLGRTATKLVRLSEKPILICP